MKIEEIVRGDVVIVRPQGRLTVESEGEFREALRRLFDGGRARLVLDVEREVLGGMYELS